MNEKDTIQGEELRAWILEELDENIRLLTAVEAFCFKDELLPEATMRLIKLHHEYLLRLLMRCENPTGPKESASIFRAMQKLAEKLVKHRLQLLRDLQDGGKVAELFYDASWNHHDLQVQLTFAPEDMLKEEALLKDKIERRAVSPHLRLRGALQGLPAHWVRVIHNNLQLGFSEQYSKGRLIAAIYARLSDGRELAKMRSEFTEDQRELFDALAGSERPLDLQKVEEQFGDDFIDGYFWDVHPPQTALGRLRALGVAYVGTRANEGGKCVAMPAELKKLAAPEKLPENVLIFPTNYKTSKATKK